MNKEVHYEGWLIKSPPTKRIWRARWRRRWFTLKQGEIPEQFCLEYYTDRNCRKLKGVIDLDQCEQVDCGLRLENRKQKFQFMFDIKTPKRTYYLAADTEADMRDWVNCICQVCHLHDTKQPNNELLVADENRAIAFGAIPTTTVNCNNDSTKNTTTSTLNSTNSTTNADRGETAIESIDCELLRSGVNASTADADASADGLVVSEQPHFTLMGGGFNNSEGAYVNTEYSNRETLMSSALLSPQPSHHHLNSLSAAIYLNSPVIPQQQQEQQQQYISYENNNNHNHHNATATRLAVNTNGVVRKLPENLVLNNTVLTDMADTQQHSVQPSPALSTASGPYIPISECFSGSPKYMLDANNPTTPLNNLDPKFYDTPRSHNNIGLNLTNDQSYSPKITNCGTVQSNSAIKNRSHRSDSDSESVFTDDDEWTHPLPLRENVDRHTRPSDSSVENESFVLTYSQRFSKLPDDAAVTSTAATASNSAESAGTGNGKDTEKVETLTSKLAESSTVAEATTNTKTISKVSASETGGVLEKFSRVFKNKNNLILDFKREHEKATTRELPQFSDTENTSPAIGPRDSNSVVEESYDIPRSHNLPYYNMDQLFEKIVSPDNNAPIAASTPNLMASSLLLLNGAEVDSSREGITSSDAVSLNSASLSMSSGTLPRPHYYTNAAPRKVEGNVFRYDFMEQSDLPPVNRKLKPKINAMDGDADKPPEEVPPVKPTATATLHEASLVSKLMTTNIQSPEVAVTENATPSKPPSVDRKSKPNAYKVGNSATLAASTRRSAGAPLSMVMSNDSESPDMFVMETRTLPRQPRPNYALGEHHQHHHHQQQQQQQQQHNQQVLGFLVNNQTHHHNHHHQRTVSAAAATPLTPTVSEAAGKNEHKLQYFDLDVTNAPAISRQSISVGNLPAPTLGNRIAKRAPTAAGGAAVNTGVVSAVGSVGAGAPTTSSVVYNSVDFVKTEAFKRIREERKKKSEEVPYQLK